MAQSPLCLPLCSSRTDWTRLPSGSAPVFGTIMVEAQNKWSEYLGVATLLWRRDTRKGEKLYLAS